MSAFVRAYIVISPGLLHAGYWNADVAGRHSRCITGTTVVPCDIFDDLPPEIREDIRTEWDSDEDDSTPVTEVPLRDIDDK